MQIFFSFLVFLFSVPASATAFKCVDDVGHVTYSSSPCADSSVKFSVLFPSDPVRKIVLKRNSANNYSGKGSFRGVPVVYLLDTGATNTTVSSRVAFAAGYRDCQKSGYTHTANGLVADCAVNADIELDGYVVKNHRVHIAPSMDADMLLGMDILQNMKMEQSDGVMVLSR